MISSYPTYLLQVQKSFQVVYVAVTVEEIVAVVRKVALPREEGLKSVKVKNSFAVLVVPVVFNHPV